MGQQQLLLLRIVLVRLAAGVQARKMKPVASGSGQSDPDHSSFSFSQLGSTPTETGQNATYDAGTGTIRIKPCLMSGAIAQ